VVGDAQRAGDRVDAVGEDELGGAVGHGDAAVFAAGAELVGEAAEDRALRVGFHRGHSIGESRGG